MADSTFIKRVILKNYRSIASCSVNLGPLCFLVGANGSGKSNFLDALRLVSDSLNSTLDHALRDRGGIKQVRRRSSGHPTHFSIELQFALPDNSEGHYDLRIGARPQGGYEVQTEKMHLQSFLGPPSFYEIHSGRVIHSSLAAAPAAAADRLYLVNVSGLPEFRPVYEAFTRMGFYNLNPQEIRELQSPDAGEILVRDGANITSILRQLQDHSPQTKKRIEEYLAKVVPGISTVNVQTISSKETLEFGQEIGGEHPWKFPAANMSDGTLRALGNLVALFQFSNGAARRSSLVGIEEPETALHPAAAGVLRDSLRDASQNSQVLVTSHSPDLLDDDSIPENQILAVIAEHGKTLINRIDETGRSALKDRLFTAGELLRMDQLRPEPQEQMTESESV